MKGSTRITRFAAKGTLKRTGQTVSVVGSLVCVESAAQGRPRAGPGRAPSRQGRAWWGGASLAAGGRGWHTIPGQPGSALPTAQSRARASGHFDDAAAPNNTRLPHG